MPRFVICGTGACQFGWRLPLHFAFFAKCAAAFVKMSFSSVAARALRPVVLGFMVLARHRPSLGKQLQLCVQRMRARAQTPGNFPSRIFPHCDRMRHVPLERVTAVACPISACLAQSLAAKRRQIWEHLTIPDTRQRISYSNNPVQSVAMSA
jgi:hypothetical protein